MTLRWLSEGTPSALSEGPLKQPGGLITSFRHSGYRFLVVNKSPGIKTYTQVGWALNYSAKRIPKGQIPSWALDYSAKSMPRYEILS